MRFLLAEFSPEERKDITLVLKPYVGFAINHSDEEFQKYLADRGINVSLKDAHAFAVTAMRENIADREEDRIAREEAEKMNRREFYRK